MFLYPVLHSTCCYPAYAMTNILHATLMRPKLNLIRTKGSARCRAQGTLKGDTAGNSFWQFLGAMGRLVQRITRENNRVVSVQ